EEHEAYGAARLQAGCLDGAQRLNYQGGVAAVVERAGTKLPGVKVGADNHKLVGLFPAANLGHNVMGGDRPAHAIGNGILHPDLLARRQQAGNALAIFTGEQHLRVVADVVVKTADVTVEQVVVAGGDEGDGDGAGLLRGTELVRLGQVLLEK